MEHISFWFALMMINYWQRNFLSHYSEDWYRSRCW